MPRHAGQTVQNRPQTAPRSFASPPHFPRLRQQGEPAGYQSFTNKKRNVTP